MHSAVLAVVVALMGALTGATLPVPRYPASPRCTCALHLEHQQIAA